MTIYLDSEFRCHLTAGEGMQAVETDYFAGKCQTYIEGFRFVPAGQSWTRSDGVVFPGKMIVPWKDIRELERAQFEYECKKTLDKIKEIVGIDDNTLLVTQIQHNYLVTKAVEEVFNVYVKVNEENYVTAVDSDAFIEDLSLWIKIDEGQGDLYKFAKNNYCKYGITASDGSYNYKLVRGRVVYMPQTPVSPTPTVEERLNDLETAICDIMDILAEM